jgi:hypothetical protein
VPAGPSRRVQHRSCALRDRLTVCFLGQHLSPNNMRGREPGLFVPGLNFGEAQPLEPWTDRRRKDLLNLLAMLDAQLESLDDAVTRVAKE